MPAKYVLAAVAVIFVVMGLLRATRLGYSHPQPRTWLLVGAMFGLVSIWLFYLG